MLNSENLPPAINAPSAWHGPAMLAAPDAWQWALSDAQIDELQKAARQLIATDQALEKISIDDFVLPQLADKLDQFRLELIDGKGFGLITGLDPEQYTRAEIATIFMGLGAHLGQPRSQNAAGHLLGHVRDANRDADDPNVRIYQTAKRQSFHTDSADVVGLICLKTAKEGGDSLLVSSETIYNAMREQRPDLAALLFEPIATDKRGEVEPGSLPYFLIPVFNWHADKLTAIYQRQYIDSAQRFEDAPRLTPKHVEALDLFDQLANSPELNFSMRLASGDMQFVHNHNMLHDRSGFMDWPKPADKRHLLRLWLSVPGARALPEVFAQRFGTTEVGNRGGVIVAGTQLQVPLD